MITIAVVVQAATLHWSAAANEGMNCCSMQLIYLRLQQDETLYSVYMYSTLKQRANEQVRLVLSPFIK